MTSLRPLRCALAVGLVGLFSCGGSAPSAEKIRDSGMLPARWSAPDGRSEEVPFSFEVENAETGLLSTTLGKGGERFRGPYVRVERSTQGELVTEVYNGWSSPEWEVWHHDADGHWTATAKSFGDFADFFTGKVVATLSGSENHAMRCQFTLTNPPGGWLHGGTGECQVSDGARVDLDF
jgi:hypothetical protein